MMFDPPDFPYKDLNETIKEQYGPEITNTATEITIQEDKVENPITVEPAKSQTNETTLLLDVNNINSELFVVQTDNLFNYEPILLDDNTVNEFLLPLQDSDTQANNENNGPDVLALHSCSICHEIFVSENELLEHSTKSHIVERQIDAFQEDGVVTLEEIDIITNINEKENDSELETEWLVCGVCNRVLSTALEMEPMEQLCCVDESGKSSINVRTLQEMYVCEFCNALYADNDAMDKHRGVCNNQNKENIYANNPNNDRVDCENVKNVNLCFSCDICGAQNVSMDELKLHTKCGAATKERRTRNSSYTKMWNCGSCNQLFATARDLYRHKRGEDRPEGAPLTAFVCEECDKVLGSMCALHTHKKMHKVTKPGYPCRVCGRRFNQSGHLAIHMRMHTGERPYPCDLCSKAFKVKVERDDHRRTHTGERPFCCTACPKTFTAAARLREHARIHTDQRPYICDICGAAFRRPYARTVHTLIHTGAKPHECDVCGTAFRRSGDMWKHKRTLHGVTS